MNVTRTRRTMRAIARQVMRQSPATRAATQGDMRARAHVALSLAGFHRAAGRASFARWFLVEARAYRRGAEAVRPAGGAL